jgi:bacterioferritin
MGPFEADIQRMRTEARAHMSEGAVTPGNKADRSHVIEVLNAVLATEIVCSLRYKFHYYAADGIHSESVKAEFLEHAQDEQQHADWVAERISQLNGKPNLNPEGLATRSHAQYVEGNDLVSMIEEDLVAERVAVELYSEIVRWLGDTDPTTKNLMERLLQKEEEHAEDLATLMARIPR